jgi:hypothetical protein
VVFPVNGIRGLVSGLDQDQFGTGPNGVGVEPLYRATQITPTLSTIESLISDANTYDMLLVLNIAGSRTNWCDPGPPTPASPSGTLIYNKDTYQSNCLAFYNNTTHFNSIKAATDSRRVILFTCDEPNLAKFNGSITKKDQNDMGLFHKSFFPNALVAQRTTYAIMNPPPSGGWTGIDYGWSQFNRNAVNSGLTPRAWYKQERDGLASIDLGQIPAFNWLDGGDGRLWDYQNTGTSSGRIPGTSGAGFWLSSPDEIREKADAVFDDGQAIAFLGYTFPDASFESSFIPYWIRADYKQARVDALNKLASRVSFGGYRTPKGTVVIPPGTGPEVDHTSVQLTPTQQSTSGSYVDVPGAAITQDQLSPGKFYLLRVTGAVSWLSTAASASVRLVSGSTVLPRSESVFRYSNTTSVLPYNYFHVMQAVAGEDIKLQFKSGDGATQVGANDFSLVVINLSDDLVRGKDWEFNQSTVSTALSAALSDGASLTVTPQSPGDDWLVLTAGYYTPSITGSVASKIKRSGELSETDPEVIAEGKDVTDLLRLSNAKVVTLGNTTNTFTEQSRNTGSGGPRTGSAVFILRLNRFASHAFSYDVSGVTLVGGSVFATNLASATITTTVAGDVWVDSSFGWAPNGITSVRGRATLDGGDVITGSTTSQYRYWQSADATDIVPVGFSGIAPVATASAHTAHLDASANVTLAGATATNRHLVAVSMALATTPGTVVTRRMVDGIGTRTGTRKAR